MTLKNCLQKLSEKLAPKVAEEHYFGWADCTWSESEGLIKQDGESKEDFRIRIYNAPKKVLMV